MRTEFVELTEQTDDSEAAVATPKAAEKLSVLQIDALESEYRRITDHLATLREQQGKRQALVDELNDRQAKAKRLLALTDSLLGFAEERDHATAVLRQVAADLPLAEQKLAALGRLIANDEATLAGIDKSLFQTCEEIRKLARELRRRV